ncbi:MAG: DUF4974 domain-containing protein, partial [Bacteroidota bacterium]
AVIRGRVVVFNQKEQEDFVKEGDTKGTIVGDREKLTYNNNGTSFVKESYDDGLIETFIFRNTPVREVLEQLKQFYGIEVVVNQDSLNHCFFNASLVDIPLMEKISLLCSAVGYEYQFENNTLTLVGSGCN